MEDMKNTTTKPLKPNNMEKSNYTGTIAKIEQREGYWVLILTNGLSGHLPSPYARTDEHLDLVKMEAGMNITYDRTNNTFNKIIVC